MPALLCPNCLANSNVRIVWNAGFRGSLYWVRQCDHCQGFTYGSSPDGVGVAIDTQTDIHHQVVRHAASVEYPDPMREDFSEAPRSLNGGNTKAAVIMTRSALQ